MCELMTNLTYAAMAAGTAAKYAAAQKSSKAMTAVQQLEAERQERLNRESEALLSEGVENNTRMSVETQLEDNKNKRLTAMNAAVDAIPVGDAVSRLGESGQNRLVQAETASKAAEADAVNKSTGKAMASMGSLSDTNLNLGISNARGLQNISKIGNFKRGSGQVANIENETASRAGEGLSQIGDILNALAVVSGGYAAQGTTPWMSATEKAANLAQAQKAWLAEAAKAGLPAAATAAGTPTALVGSSAGQVGNLLAQGGAFTGGFGMNNRRPQAYNLYNNGRIT
jgi:hypothetical protein